MIESRNIAKMDLGIGAYGSYRRLQNLEGSKDKYPKGVGCVRYLRKGWTIEE